MCITSVFHTLLTPRSLDLPWETLYGSEGGKGSSWEPDAGAWLVGSDPSLPLTSSVVWARYLVFLCLSFTSRMVLAERCKD